MYDRAADVEVFQLKFAEHPGLTVRCARPSFIGEEALEGAWPVLADPHAGRRAQRAAVKLAVDAFAQVLVDWTLHWNGRPVPATRAGLLGLDVEFLVELLRVWVEQVALRPRAPQVTDEPDPEPGEGGGVLASLPVTVHLPDDDQVVA